MLGRLRVNVALLCGREGVHTSRLLEALVVCRLLLRHELLRLMLVMHLLAWDISCRRLLIVLLELVRLVLRILEGSCLEGIKWIHVLVGRLRTRHECIRLAVLLILSLRRLWLRLRIELTKDLRLV